MVDQSSLRIWIKCDTLKKCLVDTLSFVSSFVEIGDDIVYSKESV